MLRFLTLALPSIAVAVLAYAFLLGGAVQPVVAARVFTGPTPRNAEQISVQVLVFEEYHLTESVLPRHPISVQLATTENDANPLLWSGQTNAWGFAEAQFQLPVGGLKGPAQLTVQHRGPSALLPNTLVTGELPAHLPSWSKAQVQSGVVPGLIHGEYAIEVDVLKGALAVPFHGAIELRVTQFGKEAAGIPLQLSLVGANFLEAPTTPNALSPKSAASHLLSTVSLTTDERGVAHVQVVPQSHAIELTITTQTAQSTESSRWYGALPIVPGAMQVELSGSTLSIVSPVERNHAFVRFVSRHQRIAARALSLQSNSTGFASGTLVLPPKVQQLLTGNEPVWAVVSSDPHFLSGGSVGWSLLPPGQLHSSTFSPPDSKVLDGLSAAQRTESARRQLVHQRGVFGALALLAIFGLVFFARLRRQPLPPTF